jgi:hypothetical protein
MARNNYHYPTLAEIVGPPEDGEKEWLALQEQKRLEKQKAEDNRVALHAMIAGPDCKCEWCTVKGKV